MAAAQWCFEDFRLDPVNARLWRGAEPLALPPKVFHVLHYLVTHPDRLVTKAELLDTVWPDTAVTDAVVRVAIGTPVAETCQACGQVVPLPTTFCPGCGQRLEALAPVEPAPLADTPTSLVEQSRTSRAVSTCA